MLCHLQKLEGYWQERKEGTAQLRACLLGLLGNVEPLSRSTLWKQHRIYLRRIKEKEKKVEYGLDTRESCI